MYLARILIFTFCMCMTSYLSNARDKIAVGDTMYIYAASGINLRNASSIDSKIIEKINYGEKVIVCENNGIESTINNRRGYWLKVKHNAFQGYVFSAYLSKHTLPIFEKDGAYLLIDWLIASIKNDSLIHTNTWENPGFDQDGKDLVHSEWYYYASGTLVTHHFGYEYEDFSFESFNITTNDILNFLDLVKQKNIINDISYSIIEEEHITKIKAYNFYNLLVYDFGYKTQIIIMAFEL